MFFSEYVVSPSESSSIEIESCLVISMCCGVLFSVAFCCGVLVVLGKVGGGITREAGYILSLLSARIEKRLDFREVGEVSV